MSGANSIRSSLRNPLILPFYLPALLFALAQGLLIPVLPLYVADFGVSYGLVGLVLAGSGLGMLVGDVPAGMLLKHLGQKRVMLLGLSCAGFSTVALFWASSIPEVMLYQLLAGFGTASFYVARHAYITDGTVNGGRGSALALVGGVFRLGGFVGPAIGGVAAAAFGLRAPFLVFAGVCSIAIAAVAAFVHAGEARSCRESLAPQPRRGDLIATVKEHYRTLAAAGTGQLFAQLVRSGRTVIIPLYGAAVIGLDPQAIGLVVSVAGGIEMLMFFPAGMLMDRLGRKFAIVPCFLIQASGLALVPLTGGFASLLSAATLAGLGNGLGSGTMLTLGADLAPQDSRGEFLGVWNLIGDAGSMAGPIVTGAVADILVLPAAALALSGAGFVAAGIFALIVPETLQKRPRSATVT